MISVLTATHRKKKFVRSCIESVIANSYQDWEMVIMDDCSKDGTHSEIKRFCEQDTRIKYVETSSKLHCGSSYDLLAQHSQGDIVCVLDGDDTISPTALQTMYVAYQKHPDIDYIYTQHYVVGKKREKKTGLCRLPVKGCDLATSWEKKKHCFSHMRSCRSDMLQYNIFKKGAIFAVDKYMGMMLESHGKGGFLNIPIYNYRMNVGQLTEKHRSQRQKVKEGMISEIRRYRKKNGLIAQPVVSIEI